MHDYNNFGGNCKFFFNYAIIIIIILLAKVIVSYSQCHYTMKHCISIIRSAGSRITILAPGSSPDDGSRLAKDCNMGTKLYIDIQLLKYTVSWLYTIMHYTGLASFPGRFVGGGNKSAWEQDYIQDMHLIVMK